MQGFWSGQANSFSVIGWVADGFYLTPDTRLRLEKVVLRSKLACLDGPLDQSEAIEAALSGYLDQIEAEFDDGVGVKKRTRYSQKSRMDKEERLRRAKRLIKSMDSKTFQERAAHFAPLVTGEKARTYEGLKPGEEGY